MKFLIVSLENHDHAEEVEKVMEFKSREEAVTYCSKKSGLTAYVWIRGEVEEDERS